MIEFEKIGKSFPGIAALTEVSFRVERGDCHALLGENGAGKSTLGKILAGLYRPDAGRVSIDGKPVQFHSPRDAVRAGIGIVHQELVFCPNLSVAENLCLHDLPRRFGLLDRREMRRRAESLLRQIGLEVAPDARMSTLSIAQEQMVQIAAAVGLGARILVFDEPTSSLGQEEVKRLFSLIRRLQTDGVTMLYVSHRLEEIFELCQAVTVLRDGRHIATAPIDQVHRDQLVSMMVGRAVSSYAPQRNGSQSAVERLRVRNYASPGKFSGVNLDVREGEIVGLAGLVGSGRTEVAEAIFGLDPHARGEVFVNGRLTRITSPTEALRCGIGLTPEDRKRHGLVLSMNLRENLTLPFLDRIRKWLGRIDRREERELANDYRRRLSIRAPSAEASVNSLSGGNQQKVVLAKGIAGGNRILLIDEPTRGVDVGAKREIHELIDAEAREGAAVLLISSDLPELLALSQRVIVFRAGEVVAQLSRDEATPETTLRWMTGLGES